MSTPGTDGPSEGHTHRDQQSETVGPPLRDTDPPTRTKLPGVFIALTFAVLLVLAIALVVAAIGAA